MKPVVAVIGRPNVGKSTFFNRLTRTKSALVENFPGVTRDRIYGDAEWEGCAFTLVDTGGFLEDDADAFAGHIRKQVAMAVEDADVLILLLDGRSGLSAYDRDLIDLLRRADKPVFFCVNKIDGPAQEANLPDFYGLGIDTLYPVSAEHGYGVPDFLDDLVSSLPVLEESGEADEEGPISVAVVGRPNAGKSSLINRILGEERLVVSEVAGTTRDAVDSLVSHNGKNYRFIDTAGIRRKARVSARIEKFSVIKALKSLEQCDVALIVLDAAEGIADQDIRIAGYAHDKKCGVIFLFNKWDIVEKDDKTAKRLTDGLRDAARFLPFAPVLFVSALTGRRVQNIFGEVDAVYNQYSARLSTGKVNRILTDAAAHKPPPLSQGRTVKIYYGAQVGTKPPRFMCFASHPESLHFSYKRFLTNRLREEGGFDKTPIFLDFKDRPGRKPKQKKKLDKRKRRGRCKC